MLVWFVVFLSALGALYAFHRYRLLLGLTNQLINEKEITANLFKNLECAWCYWFEGDNFVHSSLKFKKLLSDDTDRPLQVADLSRTFGTGPFNTFQRALQHLTEFTGPFSLQTQYADRFLEIQGKCIIAQEKEQTPKNGLPKKNIILLVVTDITPTMREKDQFHLLQKQKVYERDMLRLLIDIAPIALWYRDEKGRIECCNTIYAKALDTTVHRVIAENREFIENNPRGNTYDLSRKALKEKEPQTLHLHTVIDGERRLMEITEIPILETNCTAGYALDITAVEEVEDEFARHRKAFHDVLEQLSTPIAIYGADMRMIFFNQACVRLFDFDEAWLCTMPTLPEVIEDLRVRRCIEDHRDFPSHKRERRNLFNNLMHPIHETIHRPNGHVLRLVISPYPLGGLLYMFDDITDKLSLERGYKTLMAVQKETIDHLYEAILVFGSDYRLRLSNTAMLRVFDISADILPNDLHIDDLFKNLVPFFAHQVDISTWRNNMIDCMGSRKPWEDHLILKENRIISYSYVPLPDGSHLISFVDISHQRQFEQALQDRAHIFEQADQLKSNFISHISYELKSPLNTITGFTEILSHQYFGTLNERQLDYCRGISEASDRLMNLINDIIDLASIEAGTLTLQYQKANVEKFLRSTVDLVHDRANDHSLELIIDNKSSTKEIYIDQRRLKHALFNLLSNAIKFTPAGGKITLRAEDDTQHNQHIKFTVQDTGVGISSENQEKIFNLFEHNIYEKEDGEDGSIILGLSLVKRLIELHGGYLQFESHEGEGTKVFCSVPCNIHAT